MRLTDETYNLLGHWKEERHQRRTELEDAMHDYNNRIKEYEDDITYYKQQKPQNVELIDKIKEKRDELVTERDDYKRNWKNTDYTTDPYRQAQGQARKEAQAIDPNLNPSFYRDVAAAFTGRAPGNTMTDAAVTAKAQAKNQQNEASNRQMEAQASQQIADRNEYTEAGKVASMKNDAQNRQNIANKEGISGAAAALTRQTNAPDVAAERSRQDQQRNIANNRRQEADVAQQGATQSQGLGMQYYHKADEYDQDYDNNIALNDAQNKWYDAQTNYYNSLANLNNTNQNTEPVTETEKVSDTETDNTGAESTEPVTEPEDANNPRPEDMPEAPKTPNAMEGDPRYAAPDPNANGLKQQVIDLCTEIARSTNNYDERRQMLESDAFWENYDFNNGMGSDLASWKKWALTLLNTDSPKLDETQLNKSPADDTSDYRAKNIELCKAYERELSDCRMKHIRAAFDTFGKPSQEDYAWLTQRAGDYDFGSDDTEDDTVLKGYADFIRNYVYNYKPEAQEISPDNDPSVTHIGPMAQDIEKVNPACIHKDENGIESVDTGRVAMMNAGAIGDIARSLEDIKVRLARLEAVNEQ